MAIAMLSEGAFLAAILFFLGGFIIAPLNFVNKLRAKLKLNKSISIILAVVFLFAGAFVMPDTKIETDKNKGSSVSETNTDNKTNSSKDKPSKTSSKTNGTSSKNQSSNKPASSKENTSSKTEGSSKPNTSSNSNSKPTTTNSSTTSSKPDNTHTHNFAAATCTLPKTCSCGATSGSAKGHSFSAATCTSPQICYVCGTKNGTVKDHTWKAASYTEPKTCTSCGKKEGSALEVPNKENYHGHVYTGGDNSKSYHYEAQCAGKYSHEITWDEVTRRNLKPCGTCVAK